MSGHLEHLGGDRWKVRVYAGRGHDGRPHQRTRTFRAPNKRAAEKIKDRIATQLRDELDTEKARQDTFAGLVPQWLDLCRSNRRSPSTLVSYERIANLIVKRWGTKRVDALTVRDVDRWYGELLKAGMTPANIHAHHRVLRAMLRQAQKWQMAGEPVTFSASPPPVDAAEHRLPTSMAVAAVLASAPLEVRTALRLSAATGCRRGEVVGLQWGDLDGRTLTVRRSLLDVKGNRGTPKTTKTKRVRQVRLDTATVDLLAEWAVEVQRRSEMFGVSSPWVFPDFDRGGDRPRVPSWLSKRWDQLRREHGIDCNLHALRHLHATELVGAGVPITEVAGRLGHAKSTTTLAIYAHALPIEQGRSAEVAGELLGGGS